MGDVLGQFISELGLGSPHLVAPDVGPSAAQDAVASLVVGGGGAEASTWPTG
jgi:hypothetical protein